MRKYNQADRRRDGFRVRGGGMLGVNGDFDWEVGLGRDKYGDSQIGLTDSDYLRWGLDISYLFGGVVSGYGSFYSEDVETDQRNSQSFGAPDWSATTDDRFNTLTVGVEWPEAIGKLTARFNYILADSAGRIENDTSGLPSAFPTLSTKQQNITVGLSYPWRPTLDIGLDFLYERYDSNDWALDEVAPQTIPNLLAFGADAWNYSVSVIYLSLRYKPGQ